MDIFYFYNGFNNIINLGLKDPHYMSNSDLIMKDPLVIIKPNYCTKLVGAGAAAAASKISDKVANSDNDGSDMSNIISSLKQIQNKLPPQQKLEDKLKTYKVMEHARIKIEQKEKNASDERKRITQKAEDAAKEAAEALAAAEAAADAEIKKKLEKVAKEAAKKEKAAKEAAKKIKEEQNAKNAHDKAELNKIFEELDAEQNNANDADNNSDDEKSRMAKIFDLIKLIIKILVFLACLTLLPIAPFVALSYYTYQKLKVYLSQNIQSL